MYFIDKFNVDRNFVCLNKCVDLIYIKSGKARVITENIIMDLDEDECFLLDANTPYILKPRDEFLSIYRLEVSKELVEKNLKVQDGNIRTGYIYDENLEKYMDIFYVNKKEKRVSRTELMDTIKHIKKIVMDNLKYNHLVGNKNVKVEGYNSSKEEIILELLKYVDKLMKNKEEISLKIISEEINVSYSYLSRIFKEVTNYRFNNYLVNYKLRYAIDLLENTDVKISEVAYEAGFINIRNFNRVFKENTGLTPSKYRDKLIRERFI